MPVLLFLALLQAQPLSETQKIEVLIHTVESLKDATFIRNGDSYDCKKAAEHMRKKWEWKKSDIKTAHDFIRIAASSSSQSGKPYLIRFKDGKETKSGDFLEGELAKLEGKK